MTTATTYTLVLGTWLLWLGSFIGWGLAISQLARMRYDPIQRLSASVWLGTCTVTVTAVALNLLIPLGGTSGAVVSTGVLLVGWIFLSCFAWKHRKSMAVARNAFSHRKTPLYLFLALLLLALAMLPRFASGEVMDGDTGLYRYGAINFASQYPTVPGLANLQDRFGFNTSLSPLAALLGNGLWSGEGFRLVIGLLVTCLIASTALRVLSRPVGPRAGDWFAVVGTAFTLAILLTDSGRWITSPSTDVAVLVFCVASTCFLLDYVQHQERWLSGALAVFVGAVAGSVRPLAWVLSAATLLIVAAIGAQRARHDSRYRAPLICTIVWSASGFLSVLMVMLLRDAVLSGWLLYPLTSFPIDVPWRAQNPTVTGQWVSSWARTPGVPPDIVLADYAWFQPWLQRFAASREAYLMMLMASALVLPILWRSGRVAWTRTFRELLGAYPPTIAITLAWFVTAPDLRFGWAAFIGLIGVPLALLFSHRAYPQSWLSWCGVALLALMVAANVSNSRLTPRGAPPQETQVSWGFVKMTIALTPIPVVPVISEELADGSLASNPADGEGGCWASFPLCRPPGQDQHIIRRGSDVSAGFARAVP